jgi:hypothetical protein
VLEFEAATKHFGPRATLDRCTFTARPGRLTGFLGPKRRGHDRCHAGGVRLGRTGRGRGPLAWNADRGRAAGAVRLQPGAAGPVPADAGARPARSSRPAVRSDQGGRGPDGRRPDRDGVDGEGPHRDRRFGSISEHVLANAHRPVLVVGPHADVPGDAAAPVLTVAVDDSADTVAAVPVISAWQQTFGGPAVQLVE